MNVVEGGAGGKNENCGGMGKGWGVQLNGWVCWGFIGLGKSR